MLIAVLRRYVTSPRWFIICLCAFMAADVGFAVWFGHRLVEWEIDYIKESWNE